MSNQKGFIDIIVMFGIMTFATLALMSVTYQKRELQLNVDSKLAVDILQQGYSYHLQDSEAWKKTLYDSRNATTFACLLSGSVCSQTSQDIAVVRNAKDEIVVDTDADKGVQLDGTICSGYSAGNSNCPLHVNLSWKPICKTTCTNPRTIQIEVSFNRSPASGGGARFVASAVSNVVRKPLEAPIVTAVGVGKKFTCALAEGDVYCWGSNSNGVLGPAATGDSSTPIKVTGLPTGVTQIDVSMETVCAIAGGNVYCWGQYHGGSSPQIINSLSGTPLTNVTRVATGIGFSCAITSIGAAYCWGANTKATLGYAVPPTPTFPVDYNTWSGPNGPAFPVLGLSRGINGPDLGSVTDIAVTITSACAVVNGGVQCWGSNDSRGGGSDMSVSGYPDLAYDPMGPKGHKVCYPWVFAGTVLPPPPGIAGFMYGFYLSPAGGPTPYDTAMCNPKPEPTDYPILDSNVKQIRVSFGSFCALFNNGDLACWGSYDYGKLARALPSTQEPQIATTIHGVESIGHNSTGFFALKAGKLWAWGKNNAGNPMGDPNGSWAAPFFGSIWDPIELTGLPANITNFQGGATDEGYHSCAVANQQVYCWGLNDVGQLGDGTLNNKLFGTPTMVSNWP